MKRFLLNGKTVPKGLILLIDLIIIALCFSISYVLISQFHFTNQWFSYFLVLNALFAGLACIVLYCMRMHTGLLRFSNNLDMIRIFGSMLLISAVFLFSFFCYSYFDPALGQIPIYSILLINFFIASSILVMFRLGAKMLYAILIKRFEDKESKRVLILGADKNAILVKHALENSDSAYYLIEGFVAIDRYRLNSHIQQKKVYALDDLEQVVERKQISELVIVNELLGEDDKKAVLERCMQMDIKVYTVPPASQWLAGKLGSRQIKELRIEDLLQRKPIEIDQAQVCDDLSGKRILVTGAAGSIGSEIVRQILNYQPALVILCDQAESPLHETQLEIRDIYPKAEIKVVPADIRNKSRMSKLFRNLKPEVVYHAAAYKHVPLMENNPCEAIAANVQGTKILADLAVEHRTGKFVMISTDKAVNPTNVMGASKRIAEMYIQSLNSASKNFRKVGFNGSAQYLRKTRFITTRFGNVLGSNGSVIPLFRKQIEKGGPVTVTHPEITRYFMTIREAVQLVLEAGTMGKGGEIYIFDMGTPVKIVDLAKNMIRLAGFNPHTDIPIHYTGLRPGEKLYEELLASEEHTLATHHEKIRIAQVREGDYEEIEHNILGLIRESSREQEEQVVRKMKQIVPEFISNNSPFQMLDKRKNQNSVELANEF